MHDAAMEFVQFVLRDTPIPPGPVLDIGGRNINGSVRPLFDGRPYASIDLYAGRGVDLVADVCTLNPLETAQQFFQQSRVSCVVCCEVLEHTDQGQQICQWAYRVLVPDGVFIVTAANPLRFAHSGIDGGAVQPGEHYGGITEAHLREWLQPFAHCDIVINGADIYATAKKGGA